MNVNPKAYENYHKQPTAHPESVCAICGQDDSPLPVAHFHVIAQGKEACKQCVGEEEVAFRDNELAFGWTDDELCQNCREYEKPSKSKIVQRSLADEANQRASHETT